MAQELSGSLSTDTMHVLAIVLIILCASLLIFKMYRNFQAELTDRVTPIALSIVVLSAFSYIYAYGTVKANTTDLEALHAELVQSSQHREKENATLHGELKEKSSLVKVLEKKVEALSIARADDLEKLGKLEGIEFDRKQLTSKIAELEAHNKRLSNKNTSLAEANDVLKTANGKLEAQIGPSNQILETQAMEILATGNLDDLQPKTDPVKRENELLKTKLNTLMKENSRLLMENTNLLLKYDAKG